MKKYLYLAIMFLAIISCKSGNDFKTIKLTYPETKKTDVTDTYFGVIVADPYRWLENDTADEVENWVKEQNKVTSTYLEQIPFRKQIHQRLTKLWDYPKSSAPTKKGNRYFLYKNNGLQNQNVLYYKNSLQGDDIELLDPNKLSSDGTVSLSSIGVSRDGKYLAYAVSSSGSDWQEIYVRDIEKATDLKDNIKWVKFSGMAWFGDGFFYSRYPEPAKGSEFSGVNEDNKVYYHKIGDSQSADQLVYEDESNSEINFSADVTDDEKYLILYASQSTSGNALYYKDLANTNAPVKKIIDNFDNEYIVIGHYDGMFFVLTNDNAPKYKLISIDPKRSDAKYRKDIIPEEEGVLQGVSVFGDKIIASYLIDAHSVVKVFDIKGKYLYDIDIPIIGTIAGFSGERTDPETFYTVTSFTTPATIYRYDVEKNKSEIYQNPQIDFDATKYETKQIFYTSKDGTKIPMFIVHKKGIALDGSNPTILYGYGGFNISLTPYFSIVRLLWLEQGGVFAMANLRGGGEYGEEWHKAGTLLNKQNVFDDFIAAAEYLIKQKYTSPARLAIQGGSNGGLLVGAVANQRPDLFAVSLPAVGVMDMLRYHLFTIGRNWSIDYGTSADSKEMFEYLYKYSPLHNIKEGVEYPATLVTSADHDDRVVPAHSFKYIATLQASYKGERPMLIRIESKAGHGAGKPTDKIISEYADVYAFTFYNMKFTPLFEK
ncbi:MAG: S9 family peptidase [Bacteroidales bacterium]|nr:S9 family peptidase [Bacteroidales bacterium]HQP04833.1 prolyl oligopeptidase family serine peptidase [Bacteroidales bacterium]